MQLPQYAQGFFDGYQAGFQAAMAGGQFRPEMGPGAPIVPAEPTNTTPKRKRRPSKYAKAYGKAYKMHRKKHPRAQHLTIVNKAHRTARAEMKKK